MVFSLEKRTKSFEGNDNQEGKITYAPVYMTMFLSKAGEGIKKAKLTVNLLHSIDIQPVHMKNETFAMKKISTLRGLIR